MRAGNARPYDIDFSADENSTYGMGKSIPYMIRRSTVVRCKIGFIRTLDTGRRQSPYRYSLNAPLKKCASEKT